MNTERLNSFLHGWTGTRRHAELWRQAISGQGEPVSVANACLQLIVSEQQPSEVVYALIDEGSFDAAEALLSEEPFSADEAPRFRAELREVLDRRRMMGASGVLGEVHDLVRHSRSIGAGIAEHDPRLNEVRFWASRDLKRAAATLNGIRRTIEHLEATIAGTIRDRVGGEVAGEQPTRGQWRRTIERALEDRQFDLAQALLAAGETGLIDWPHPPIAVRHKLWPFRGRHVRELLRWSLDGHGGSAEFYAKWDPLAWPSNRTLVEAIDALLADASPTQSHVTAFVEALQQKLLEDDGAGAVKGMDPVHPTEYGFEGRLRGLQRHYAPALWGNDAIRFCIESPGTRFPTPSDANDPSILFTLEQDRDRAGWLVVQPTDLVRCLAGSNHFVSNFLHVICAQLPPARIVPDDPQRVRTWLAGCYPSSARGGGRVSFDALRQLAAGVIDVNGFTARTANVSDRLAFYASGHPYLLSELLSCLFHELYESGLPRAAPIEMRLVEDAFWSERYSRSLRRELLEPIEADAARTAVFAAGLAAFALHELEQAPVTEIEQWLELGGTRLSDEQISACLDWLARMEVFERDEHRSEIMLTRYGGGHFLLRFIRDREEYFKQACGALRTEGPDTPTGTPG